MFLTVAVIMGCSRDGQDVVQDNEQGDLLLSVSTKDGSPGSDTYRAVLFNYDAVYSVYSAYRYQGTYRNRDAKDWMTPCKVNSTTGEWIADGSEYGLRASTVGSYRLSLVSPAVLPDWTETGANSNVARWGYRMEREGVGVKVSSPTTVSVSGNHLNRKYVYQASEEQLKDRRSKLTVRLKCGEDLVSVRVGEILIKDVYSTMYYDFGSDSLYNPVLDTVGEILYDSSEPEIELLNGEAPVQVYADYYLFALNYDSIDGEYHFIYDVPKLELTIGSGKVVVPLNHKFKPQYSYTYTLSINSAFIKMSIIALPWDEASGIQDVEIGSPVTETVTFITGSWDTVDGGAGQI